MTKVTGEGSLQAMEQPERTCRRWRMQVRTGRDYVNGGYSRRTRVFRGTKTEARKALRSFISEVESGLRVDKANLSFAAYAAEWVKEREASGEISKGTLRKNEYHVSAMLPYIGNVRVVDIDADTVARLVVKLRNEGGKRCAGLSGTSVRGMFVTLSHMLGDAVTRDMLLANPCSKVKPPKNDTKEKEALPVSEAQRLVGLLTAGMPDAHRMGALLALSCGLRREEVCGLRWSDFDTTAGCVRVTHALPADGKKLAPPKSDASRRTIPLDGSMLSAMDRWKSAQAVELLGKGIAQKPETPVVSSAVGGFMHPQNFARWWSFYAKRNGLEGYTLHQLRHTFATVMVASGVDMVTAADLMGHSDTAMLAKVYAHLVPENATRAVAVVGGVLFGGKETPVVPFAALAKGA